MGINPDQYVKIPPKELTEEDLKDFIQVRNVPKGCYVCIGKNHQIIIDKGDCEGEEYLKFVKRLMEIDKESCFIDGTLQENCSGKYIKNK
jgi:hypothetical protein